MMVVPLPALVIPTRFQARKVNEVHAASRFPFHRGRTLEEDEEEDDDDAAPCEKKRRAMRSNWGGFLEVSEGSGGRGMVVGRGSLSRRGF